MGDQKIDILYSSLFCEFYIVEDFLFNPIRYKDQMLHLITFPIADLNPFHSDDRVARKGIFSLFFDISNVS